MSEILYDPKCKELAEHFLEGNDIVVTLEMIASLAAEIQEAVDAWFEQGGAS